MNDDQKWLEAAAALEQDILYLKAASRSSALPHGLDQEIGYLKVAVGVYRKNAAAGVAVAEPGRSVLHQRSFMHVPAGFHGHAARFQNRKS